MNNQLPANENITKSFIRAATLTTVASITMFKATGDGLPTFMFCLAVGWGSAMIKAGILSYKHIRDQKNPSLSKKTLSHEEFKEKTILSANVGATAMAVFMYTIACLSTLPNAAKEKPTLPSEKPAPTAPAVPTVPVPTVPRYPT